MPEFRFGSRFFSLPDFKGQFLFCHLCHVRCSKCIELIACEMCSDRIYSFPHFFSLDRPVGAGDGKGPRFSEKDWHYLQAQTDMPFHYLKAVV